MTKNELKVLMMNLTGGMNTLVRQINNKDYLYLYDWLTLGVPEDATEEDLEQFVKDPYEFADLVDLFSKIIWNAVRDGGFCTKD